MNNLATMLGAFLSDEPIRLIDVGSSGGLEPRWRRIQDAVAAILFEPNPRDSSGLDDSQPNVYSSALGSRKTERTLLICKKNQASSFLEPNLEFLARFPETERFDIVHREKVGVDTMDGLLGRKSKDIDFIKLDTQGTELDILKGASRTLEQAIIGLEIEVEFLPIYKGQPLFGAVCEYLQEKGYEFIDFTNICRWERAKFSDFGQAVFGDALFMRTPEQYADMVKSMSSDLARRKTKAYFAVCALYGRADLLPVCVQSFASRWRDHERELAEKITDRCRAKRKKQEFVLRIANRFLRRDGIFAGPFG